MKPAIQRPRAISLDPKVQRVVWSGDGKLLASEAIRYQKASGTKEGLGGSPGYDKSAKVKVWDALTGKEIYSLSESKIDSETVTKPSSALFDFCFAPDSSLLAVSFRNLYGDTGNKIELWDPREGKRIRTIETQDAWGLPRIAFSPDGKSLAVLIYGGYAEDDPTPGIVRIYDVATGKTVQIFRNRGRGARYIVYSPDGRLLATVLGGVGGNPTGIALWNVQTGKRELGIPGNAGVATFSPDGKVLATAGMASVHLWDSGSGTSIRDFTAPTIPAVLAFSPDGRFLAGAGHQNNSDEAIDETWLFDAKTGQLLRTWTKMSLSLSFMPDGKTLAVLTSDGIVRQLDLPKAAPSTNKPAHADFSFAKLIDELIATRKTDEQAVDAVFLAVLGRFPDDGERKRGIEQVTGKKDRQAALIELAWSLINSKEYSNHVQALNQLVPHK